MLNPQEMVIGGWDINNSNLAVAMERACVLDSDLQTRLYSKMEHLVPLPSIFYPNFVAHNQSERANHILAGSNKWAHLCAIMQNISNFKQTHDLEQVIVLWTASTERSTFEWDIQTGDQLLEHIRLNDPHIAPSHIFATAAILTGSPFINCAAQNTLTTAVRDLAVKHNVFVVGNDLKTGQTKMKSMLLEMLLNGGIKPESVVSYNHLGNNDGYNLSEHAQFMSKASSKSDVVQSLAPLYPDFYPDHKGPDHAVVIQYVPFVKDSKRAMDEYTSSIFMGGRHTLVLHNTCEDSLLAAPLMIDLCVLVELFTRVQFCRPREQLRSFHPVLSMLSYFMKHSALATKKFQLSQQYRSLTNLLCILAGIHVYNDVDF